MPTLSSIIPPINLSSVSGTIAVSNGGTGATSLTGVVKGTGASALTAGTVSLTTEVSGTLPVANGGTGATTLTANNVLLGNGTSALQAVAPGASGNILTSNGTTWTSAAPAPSGPTLTAVASGSLSNGSTVIINSDGTVSAVAGVTQSIGDASNNGVGGIDTGTFSTVYDIANDKLVQTIDRAAAPASGRCVVGSISGTSITYGSEVTFQSGSVASVVAVYDPVAQKVVVFYTNGSNSNYGTAVVGTVSGTSISFGSPVVFSSVNGSYPQDAAYDVANQKVVLSFLNSSTNASFGIVGTVSGSSISFGTPTQFTSNYVNIGRVVYHAGQQRTVFVYNASSTGYVVVATISGTSISFGTTYTYASNANITAACYDSDQQRIIIAFRWPANANSGSVVAASVSGTAVTVGSTFTFEYGSGSFGIIPLAAVYDPNAKKTVITYGQDITGASLVVVTATGSNLAFGTPVSVYNSGRVYWASSPYAVTSKSIPISYTYGPAGNYATMDARVFQNQYYNLTAENFIGISNAAYTNGQTATIQIAGSVDDAQSGLTPGKAYYVQLTGTISQTPGSPSVFAGTAVSATKLIVKG